MLISGIIYLFSCSSIPAINIKKLLICSSRCKIPLKRGLLFSQTCEQTPVRFFANVFLRLKIIDPFPRTFGHGSAVPRSHPMATGISFSRALLSNPLDSSFFLFISFNSFHPRGTRRFFRWLPGGNLVDTPGSCSLFSAQDQFYNGYEKFHHYEKRNIRWRLKILIFDVYIFSCSIFFECCLKKKYLVDNFLLRNYAFYYFYYYFFFLTRINNNCKF